MDTFFTCCDVTARLHSQFRGQRMLLKPFATLLPLFFSVVALLGLCMLGGLTPQAEGQTAQFSGVQSTVGSGFNKPRGVAVDSSGDVFIADVNNNSVKEILAVNGNIPANPTINTLGSGFYRPHDVAVDSNGNVFVADTGNGQIKEIVAAGGYTTVHTLGGNFAFNGPYGLAVDANANVYVADTFNSAVEEILAGAYTTVNTLGSGFDQPQGVTVDPYGNVFVSDTNHSLVKEMLAVNGSIPADPTINTLGSGYTSNPVGLAVDASGNLYIADNVNGAVYEVLAVNGSIPTSNPVVVSLGYDYDSPSGVAFGPNGSLYVIDASNTDLDVLMPQAANFGPAAVGTGTPQSLALNFYIDTNVTMGSPAVYTQGATGLDFALGTGSTCVAGAITAGNTCTLNVTFAPTASGLRTGAAVLTDSSGNTIATAPLSGTGTGPQVTFSPGTQKVLGTNLSSASGVAVDGNGNLFIGNFSAGTVQEVLKSGGYATVNTLGSGFDLPYSVALDGSDNVFLSDYGHSAVKEILASGGYATVVTLGSGFYIPAGVAVDRFGNVFVADYGNSAVKEILADSGYTIVNTLGGGFSMPVSVAVDQNGDVFVADSENSAVKEIVAVNGSIPAVNPTINTLGSGFILPYGLTVDLNGNVIVTDYGSNSVQEIVAAGGYATVKTLASNVEGPFDVALDGSGNVYVGTLQGSSVTELDYADAPSLSFASTSVGTTSDDSPQTVTLTNYGNAALSLIPPASGVNPSLSSGFTLDNSSTCPQVGPSSNPGSLAASESCTLAVDFVPTTAGAGSGSLVLTDNALNAGTPNYASQTIALSGTGTVGATTLTLAATPGSSTFGGSVTLTATLSPDAKSDGETITFKSGSTTLGTGKLAGGVATLTTTALPVGTDSLTAVYAGDVDLAGSTSNTVSFIVAAPVTVNKTTPTIAVSSSANPVVAGSSLTLQAKVTATSGTPTGTVMFKDGSTELGSERLSNGVSSYSSSSMAAGTHAITAIYSGDGNFNTVTSTVLQEVVQSPVSPTVNTGITIDFGSSTASQTVAPNSTATYTVTFAPVGASTFANDVSYTLGALPPGWSASFSPASIAAGSGSKTVTLTLSNGGSASLVAKPMRGVGGGAAIALGMLLLPFSGRMRATGRKLAGQKLRVLTWGWRTCILLVTLLGACAAMGVMGCSGASSETYQMTLTAKSGSLSQSSTVYLTVR